VKKEDAYSVYCYAHAYTESIMSIVASARYNKELEDVSEAEEDPMEKLFIWFGKIPMLLAAQTIIGLVSDALLVRAQIIPGMS
jgi:hypothetical protein